MLCSVAPSAIMNLLFLLPLVSPRSCARDPIAVTDDGLVHRRHHWCRGAPRGPVRRLGGRPRAAPVYSQSTCPMLQSFEHMHEHASDEHEFEFESSVVSAGCSGSAVLSRNRRGRIGRGAEVGENKNSKKQKKRRRKKKRRQFRRGGIAKPVRQRKKGGGNLLHQHVVQAAGALRAAHGGDCEHRRKVVEEHLPLAPPGCWTPQNRRLNSPGLTHSQPHHSPLSGPEWRYGLCRASGAARSLESQAQEALLVRPFQHAAPRIEANRQSRTRLDAALQLG